MSPNTLLTRVTLVLTLLCSISLVTFIEAHDDDMATASTISLCTWIIAFGILRKAARTKGS